MKNIKKYFKMIITAVICFAMSIVPGKKVNAKVVKVLADGQAVSHNTKRNAALYSKEHAFVPTNKNAAIYTRYRFGSYLKKIFFWLQGPGDRCVLTYDNSG